MAVDNIRATLRKYCPEDLVISIDPEMVSIETSGELMRQVDFIVATGGGGFARAAYSSVLQQSALVQETQQRSLTVQQI